MRKVIELPRVMLTPLIGCMNWVTQRGCVPAAVVASGSHEPEALVQLPSPKKFRLGASTSLLAGRVTASGRCGSGRKQSSVDQRTVKVPFIPAAACPSTVQRYGYEPCFLNVTATLAVLPGWISPVLLPSIVKSCKTWPTFLNANVTLPGCAMDMLESLKKNSPPVTWIAPRVLGGTAAPPLVGAGADVVGALAPFGDPDSE